MNTKTIQGKKYVEYDEHKALRVKTIQNTLFLILLFAAIVLLFGAITTIIDNKEMLQNEPLSFVMEQYGFSSCSCFDQEGKLWTSQEINPGGQ